MRKNKGISLIVLVITIIVIIIIAGAIIMSLNNSSIIEKVQEAKFKSDVKNLKSELSLWMSSEYASKIGNVDLSNINADKTTGDYENKTITDMIPSIANTKYIDEFQIVQGQLVYTGLEQTERDFLKEIDVISLLPETIAYKDRVEADGARVVDVWSFNENINFLKDKNIYDNLVLYITTLGGIKKNTVTEIPYVQTAYDFKGNDGVQNIVTSQPQLKDLGMKFDGANDYINCGNDASLDIIGEITICSWVNIHSLTNGSNFGLIDRAAYNQYQLKIASDLTVVSSLWHNGVRQDYCYGQGGKVNIDKWEFVCMTYDGVGTVSSYINGNVQYKDTKNKGQINSKSASLVIGNVHGYYWNGLIDNVMIFSQKLEESEILALYNFTRGKYIE